MMEGKNVLVTGASSGVGLAMAIDLAKLGATIIMISRDPNRGQAARDEVAHVAAGAPPILLLGDLSAQSVVRGIAAGVRQRVSHIDVLVNNAASAFAKRQLSVDGIEMTFATNHLAPFLLTHLLIDLVQAAPAGRIVNVTASAHSRTLDFDNLQLGRRYHFFRAYTLSKLGNVLFTYELARRVAHSGVTANCFCPGPSATSFGRGAGGLLGLLNVFARVIGHSAHEGARTGVMLATAPELAGVTGRYFLGGKERPSKPITHDADVAARMWRVSEELCRISTSELRATNARAQSA